jgi:hypothetical protein
LKVHKFIARGANTSAVSRATTQMVACWRLGVRTVYVGVVVDEVALSRVIPQVLWFHLVIIIQPPLHIDSCIVRGTYNRPISGRSSTQT